MDIAKAPSLNRQYYRKSEAVGVLFRLLNRYQRHIEKKHIKGALKW